jgi:GNAT superfamily N-acetyltransferase
LDAEITIRSAKRTDTQGFLKLLVALARFEKLKPPSPAAKRRIVGDIFDKKRINLLLATKDGKRVGYALYFYTYSSFLAKPTLYLEDIFVLDEFRGLGVGKSLFMKCVKEAARRGCGRMEWAVLNWNRNAIRFYEALGAKRLSDWSVFRLDSQKLRRISIGASNV